MKKPAELKQSKFFEDWWERFSNQVVLGGRSLKEIAFAGYTAALSPRVQYPPKFDRDKFYAVDGGALLRIQAAMDELYKERTLNADDMRDLAHKLFYALDDVEVPESIWGDDNVQFARLLSEIHAAGLTDEQVLTLSESMDLAPAQIQELFERAETSFEESKQTYCP